MDQDMGEAANPAQTMETEHSTTPDPQDSPAADPTLRVDQEVNWEPYGRHTQQESSEAIETLARAQQIGHIALTDGLLIALEGQWKSAGPDPKSKDLILELREVDHASSPHQQPGPNPLQPPCSEDSLEIEPWSFQLPSTWPTQ
jgi:hypothetical protein